MNIEIIKVFIIKMFFSINSKGPYSSNMNIIKPKNILIYHIINRFLFIYSIINFAYAKV